MIRFDEFYQVPHARVTFSGKAIEKLIVLAEHHYDYRCRETAKQGGVLFGIRNRYYYSPAAIAGISEKLMLS